MHLRLWPPPSAAVFPPCPLSLLFWWIPPLAPGFFERRQTLSPFSPLFTRMVHSVWRTFPLSTDKRDAPFFPAGVVSCSLPFPPNTPGAWAASPVRGDHIRRSFSFPMKLSDSEFSSFFRVLAVSFPLFSCGVLLE